MKKRRDKIVINNVPTSEDLIADKKEIMLESVKRLQEVQKRVPIEKHSQWYKDEYMKQWQFNKLPRIKTMKVDPNNGSLLRMRNVSAMKYKFNYNTMDMIIVVIKLYDYGNKKETNYATLVCELTSNIKPIRKELLDDHAVYGNVAFTFYSASPSYISCDGEYRARFSLFKSLILAKRFNADLWDEIESYVQRIKSRRQWSLYASYFYPKLEQELKNTEVEYAVKNELIPSTLLTITWLHTVYDEMLGITKTNINKNFKDIFLGPELANDIEFLKELIDKYGADRVEAFRAGISHTSPSFLGESPYMQMGYKMIPLNLKEVQDPVKLRYKPWKEYFISNKSNDLVINSICPGFAITLDWFYIKNSRKGLYDNQSQYNRMKHSEIAKEILHVLYEAQRGTYFATENIKTQEKSSGQIKKWISSKFKKLNDKINDPVNYCIEEIIMSEVTLSFASEYVGRTYVDTVALVQTSKLYDELIGHPFKPDGYDYFAKYMFETCYNLLCLSSKLGIIHGDFHLNNATIGPVYYLDKEGVLNKGKVNKVVYAIDDETQFVFPNNGYFSCIIDFSRSIVNPGTYDILRDISLPPSYPLVDNEDRFTANEINSLLTLYIQLFPNKIKQKDELVVIFKHHFDLVFKLLSCVDLYMFTVRLSKLLGQSTLTINKKAIELVDKLNRLSEEYIAVEMNHLIYDSVNYSKKLEDIEWPMLSIIRKCFPEYIDGQAFKNNIGVITDVYNYNNEMKYSIAKYETFPEILKYVKYVDDKGELIEVKEVTEKRKANRKEYEQEKLHNLEMMSYIAMRHAQKI